MKKGKDQFKKHTEKEAAYSGSKESNKALKSAGHSKKENRYGRRDFLKKAGMGGLSLAGAGMLYSPIQDQINYSAQKVNRNSSPTDLKITDMRIAELEINPILKIYTNQGITGLGDVRDGASSKYALMLKSRILGKNPCNVEEIFRIIKQFGGQGRQAGGVCAVEEACMDIAGKAYGVPCYQLLGGKYRDEIRIYCDTTASKKTPKAFAQRMKERQEMGFTWLKMDVPVDELLEQDSGTLTNKKYWKNQPGGLSQWTNYNNPTTSYASTKHPFTRIQITPKGIDKIVEFVSDVRKLVGYEIPISTDHWGHIGMNECIKLTQAMEPYSLAWMEDLIPWFYTEQWKEIKTHTTTPVLTGEDIYLLEGFKPLLDNHAVDMIHPDINSSGGLVETKKIGDYAEQKGIAMALHHYATPISYMASVHTAAATWNFTVLEDNGIYYDYWDDLVSGIDKPIINQGYVHVPENPGLGVTLNDDVVKQHLKKGGTFFEPTPQWDTGARMDRTWS